MTQNGTSPDGLEGWRPAGPKVLKGRKFDSGFAAGGWGGRHMDKPRGLEG